MPLMLIPALKALGLTNLEFSRKTPDGISTYKKGLYCGPGWGFTYQDVLDGKIKKLPEAVDAIDAACKAHHQCYKDNGYFTQGCNLVLSVDLVKIISAESSTNQQRIDAVIMAAIFFVETQTIDLGVMAKREIDTMRDRMLGYLSTSLFSLEQAIQREIMSRSGAGF